MTLLKFLEKRLSLWTFGRVSSSPLILGSQNGGQKSLIFAIFCHFWGVFEGRFSKKWISGLHMWSYANFTYGNLINRRFQVSKSILAIFTGPKSQRMPKIHGKHVNFMVSRSSILGVGGRWRQRSDWL